MIVKIIEKDGSFDYEPSFNLDKPYLWQLEWLLALNVARVKRHFPDAIIPHIQVEQHERLVNQYTIVTNETKTMYRTFNEAWLFIETLFAGFQLLYKEFDRYGIKLT